MRKEKAENASNVVIGTFSFVTQSVEDLFDTGTTHSFISAKLVEILKLNPTQKPSLLSVMLSLIGKLRRARSYMRVIL